MFSAVTSIINSLIFYIKKNPLKIIIVISIVYPFFLYLNHILKGYIPFWYDPARDFLLALNNLEKPTLIGPPSGIPGIFYGPYWIWMISLVQIFSKDPRLATIIILLLPYFTVFPYFVFKFSKVYSKKICLLLWLLFIFSSQSLATYLWSPQLSPLLFLILVYIFVNLITPKSKINMSTFLKIISAGMISGLIINFHISFGLGILLAGIIFLILVTISNCAKNKYSITRSIIYSLTNIFSFILGFTIIIFPSIIFEFRHDFLQSRALIKTLTDAIIYSSASVGQTGLKQNEIVQQLLVNKTADLLSLKSEHIIAIYFLIIGLIFFKLVKKKISLDTNEKNLILYLTVCTMVLLCLFTSSKNPVWAYHFTGVEIIVILTTGIVVKKLAFLEKTLSFWMVTFGIASIISLFTSLKSNPYSISSLATKKHIVELVYQDAGKNSFSVYAYSPSIYTYDFDYIFRWLGEDVYRKLPKQDAVSTSVVYLIIPKTSEAIQQDFINYKTPDKIYTTVDKWIIDDGTVVIKRSSNK